MTENWCRDDDDESECQKKRHDNFQGRDEIEWVVGHFEIFFLRLPSKPQAALSELPGPDITERIDATIGDGEEKWALGRIIFLKLKPWILNWKLAWSK